MPLRMITPPVEMVTGYKIRIGNEWIKHDFGARVPIRQAVKMARDWLDTFDTPEDRT